MESIDPLESFDPPIGRPTETPLDRVEGDLRGRVARGTIINASFNVALNLLGLLKGFIAAAFLTRADYGVWGFLFVSLGTLVWLKQVGIGDKYIQQNDPDQKLAFQRAFTLELLLSGVFTVLLLLVVPLLALFTSDSSLIAPGIAIALVFPGLALQAPLWVYYRRMDFVRQRSLQVIDPVLAAAVTIVLAATGAGYWSLVAGFFAGTWAGAIVAMIASPYPIALRYDRGTLRQYASFSLPLFVAGLTSLVLPQGSVLIGEKTVGFAGVGAIALAVTIAQFAARVDEIVTTTIYPAICAVRDRTDLLFESFVTSNRLALMWGVPFGVGLALFAPDIVDFGIGSHWRPALGLIQVFGLIAAADQIGFNWDAYFRARGDTRPIAVVSVIAAITFLAVTTPLLIVDGLDGFAIGMAAVTVATIAGRAFFLRRIFAGFTFTRHALRAIAPTIPAVAVVLAARLAESGSRTLLAAILEAGLYLAATAVATLLLERDLLRELLGYLRPGGKSQPAAT